MTKTLIVSNRLPVSIKEKEGKFVVSPSAGGLATGLGSVYKTGENIWIGWPGDIISEEDKMKTVSDDLLKENMAPVFLSESDVELFYEGFSNSTLWPLFHYFTKHTSFVEENWEAYKRVNEKYCHEILKYAEPNDTIWVHDYQLLLLPKMLREALPNATIGFFQHIPFPSYEIFRILPWREEILQGMTGADLIGFHTFDDVRHFLSSVSRIIGVDNQMGQLRVNDRLCHVDAFPMGIDVQKFQEAALSEETQNEIKNYKRDNNDRKLIISIDRLDYSKGIPERLRAYDFFLEQYPDFKNKVTLILVVVPSRDQVSLYKKLKIEIDELVGRINGKHGDMGWSPIQYFYRSFPFQSLSAFYSMCDIALVTPLRDGMNLVCKEYIASRTDKKGVLILSEMAGAAKELSEAIVINPHDLHELSQAIHQALVMPQEEQARRMEELSYIVRRYDIHHWVHLFMERLEYTMTKQKELVVRRVNAEIKEQIITDFQKAKSRIIFLDYDGTLMPFNADPTKVRPDKDLINTLQRLSANPKNKVVVISGRDKDTLQEWLGHLSIDMIGEHGVWLREGRAYWSLFEYITDEWKAQIRPVMELFVDRTPGSFVETKDYSLVWHFRKADKELGSLRARELVDTLKYLTNNMNIKIMEGNKVIEVKNAGINKGKAALKWLKKDYDFIMAAGDDWTDEDMFAVMPETAYTLKVGYSSSFARFNIASCNDQHCEEMRMLLNAFAADVNEEATGQPLKAIQSI
ncbi:MAG TPA: bifunctional alpha,alpha-trehalose-phosphate synthase (UDP-forming)/trehalose-phosphatase [Cytophagaceae bacterium]|jgi:trehalose 6-phosphate synthase/phosphatase